MALDTKTVKMRMKRSLFDEICSYNNLELAFRKAKRRKKSKLYVRDFEKNLNNNLLELRTELLLHSYKPKPLKTFILRDPKTRKISKAEFRDRVVHHALCNIIEPIFEKSFIYDSYANRKGKGSLKAIQRFDKFKRKVSKNNTRKCFVLKADIKHYFEEVDTSILVDIIEKKIKDTKVIWLTRQILDNFSVNGNGMPLGNLTSQFFANIYLNELDKFVKHKLKTKYYIRYVDDFVILHSNQVVLETYKEKIKNFLKNLKLDLHTNKSKIKNLDLGISFLGYRIFYYHKLLRKSNLRRFNKDLKNKLSLYEQGLLTGSSLNDSLNGWFGYAMWANTYNLRKPVAKLVNSYLISV